MKNLYLFIVMIVSSISHADVQSEDFKKLTLQPGDSVQLEAILKVDTCNSHRFSDRLVLLKEDSHPYLNRNVFEYSYGVASTRKSCGDNNLIDFPVASDAIENTSERRMVIYVPSIFNIVKPSNK